ncbi:ParB/RepB/Spo0J family partition protein [Woeseiaceae bacterium]|jgi:ParB family transcriptional regulator, chromosome partitioning protein|nr:ParB/RepB/Spo0J family partition protein [Woeseiaceae bacterium]|tara:strand:- start:20 stop:901 length:882 start_codon:yes stop_codon:yes gene_type:complete
MTTKKRLGRGLDALLGTANTNAALDYKQETVASLKKIPIDQLQRGQYQPRIDMRKESLEELASSIKSQGIVQPIIIRPLDNQTTIKYEIIAGERRWRAAQIAGLSDVPAVIRDIPDADAIAMALIENIQRENLNPLEEARALDRLIKEFKLTHQEAADAVGRSRAAVSNLLRLMDLPETVANLLVARKIDMGHARALLALKDTSQQITVALLIVKKSLSVRATESYIRNFNDIKQVNIESRNDVNPDIKRLEIEVSEKLGAKLSIEHKVKGSGKIVINYNDLDELEGILEHIN